MGWSELGSGGEGSLDQGLKGVWIRGWREFGLGGWRKLESGVEGSLDQGLNGVWMRGWKEVWIRDWREFVSGVEGSLDLELYGVMNVEGSFNQVGISKIKRLSIDHQIKRAHKERLKDWIYKYSILEFPAQTF